MLWHVLILESEMGWASEWARGWGGLRARKRRELGGAESLPGGMKAAGGGLDQGAASIAGGCFQPAL